MTKLQTKSGKDLFTVAVVLSDVEIRRERKNNVLVAYKNGEEIGLVTGKDAHPKGTKEGVKVKLEDLVPATNIADLMKKDPTKMTPEEIAALQAHLANVAAAKVDVSDEEDAKEEVQKAAEKKTGKKAEKPAPKKEKKEEPKEEESDEAELPEGVESIEDLEAMSAKQVWAVAKPIADELDGINSRSKKAEMIEALAEYFDLEDTESDEEEEEDLEEDDVDAAFDEEEEDDAEDEDEDDEEDEDEEEYDEDEDEEIDEEEEEDEEEDDDEDFEDDEEEDEDEDEDHELTPEDIDALETKQEVVAIMKQYNIPIPKAPKKGNLTLRKVRAYIKEQLFGDE